MVRLGYIVGIISIALMCILAQELYSDQYDNIDIDSILQNNRLRDQYYNCFMEKAPCITADAKFFKETVMEASQSHCKKCTPRQKEMIDLITDWYIKNKPDQWDLFVAKYSKDVKEKNADK